MLLNQLEYGRADGEQKDRRLTDRGPISDSVFRSPTGCERVPGGGILGGGHREKPRRESAKAGPGGGGGGFIDAFGGSRLVKRQLVMRRGQQAGSARAREVMGT
jgi:hypothetical protein